MLTPSINERLLAIIHFHGYSLYRYAKVSSMSTSVLYALKEKRSLPSLQTIYTISRHFNIDLELIFAKDFQKALLHLANTPPQSSFLP